VLVVEDEAPVRTATCRLLERAGYRVREARDGVDALLAWWEHGAALDAVVTDLRMPQLGGRELAARLRLDRPGLRVVFVTGYAEDRAEIVDGPRQRLVEKPFTAEGLLGALDALLQGVAPSVTGVA
jgi:CheY-like chemotaxis protein